MSLNTAQLWQSIQENGLANAAECRDWASQIVETSGATSLNDPQLLLAQLVKLKKITPFQANAFLSNSSQTLTIGRHRLLAPLTSPALTHWFEAIDPTSNAARWIYAIPAGQLQSEELKRHPPSLVYSKKQASVKGDSLQSMSPPAMLDGYLIVAATPAPGKPLRDELKNYHHNVLPNEKAMKIIYSLSVALADLHKQGVVHGRIGIDQIWWDGAEQVTLLRDPFFPPVTPLTMDVPVAVGVAADQDFRIRYAAPEFTAPAQQPTPATDMYALGCLWWELLTGRLPYWDTMLDKVPTSACMFPLPIPQNVGLSQGQSKCLEYLLAKTPSTRFQNGSDFLNALKVVVPTDWIKRESSDSNPQSSPDPIVEQASEAKQELPNSPSTSDLIEHSETDKTPTQMPLEKARSVEASTALTAEKPKAKRVPSPPEESAKSGVTATPNVVASPDKGPKQEKPGKPDLTAKTILPPSTGKQAVAPELVAPKAKSDQSSQASKSSAEPATPNASATTASTIASAKSNSPKQEKSVDSSKEKVSTVPESSPKPVPLASSKPIDTPKSTDASPKPTVSVETIPATNSPLNLAVELPANPPGKPEKGQEKSLETNSNTKAKPVPPVASPPVANAKSTGKKASRKKKKKPVWLLPSMVVGSVALLGFLVWMLTGNSNQTKVVSKNVEANAMKVGEGNAITSSDNSTSAAGSSATPGLPQRAPVKPREVDPLTEQFIFATAENSFPWLPPRAAKPYSLEMLPPGLQGLLVVRPAVWTSEDNGFTKLEALLKPIELLWEPIRKNLGTTIDDIQQISLGLYGSSRDDGYPELVYRLTLKKPTSVGTLKASWKNYEEQPAGEKNHLWATATDAIFTHTGPVDEQREITQFTWGPINLIRDLAEVDGNASAITRSLEELWQLSDSQSDLSLLVSTNFLFSSARNLLPAINGPLSESLQRLIADKTLGFAFTTSLTDSWYGELRMLGREGAESAKLLEEMRSIAKDLSNNMEKKLVETPAHAYWRALAIRYPQMLRALDKHLRFGLESGQIVANYYLPKSAASNLAVASWMMLQPSSFQQGSAPVISSTKPAVQPIASAFALLEHPVTISFEQEPLDSALALLTEELNSSLPPGVPKVAISIDGKAFELSSVTRNQQIRDFRFKGAPLRNLLTDLASRVNPDKTITTVKDAKQAVVWIVEENAGAQEVVFTTRRGIEGKDKKLPLEFSAP
jgi:hypothetical protein